MCLGLALALGGASRARAELPPPAWSELYDGGALAFIYLPLAVTLGLRGFVEPPEQPRLFDPAEGGATFKGSTVPEVWVIGYVGLSALTLAAVPSEGRWFHLKGFAQAQLTTLALTEIVKDSFGRHRPDYAENTEVDERRSFFSGHASMTFVTSTYLAAYLHGHVFDQWRDPDASFAWWEVAPLGLLAAGSVGVAYSRIADNRHHPSDVATGAVVGTALGTLFYFWQDSRLASAQRAELLVAPTAEGVTLSLSGRF